jgi:hypothetical protein
MLTKDKKWLSEHVRTSQYMTQNVECLDNTCMSAEQLSKISMFREWLRQYVPSDFVK